MRVLIGVCTLNECDNIGSVLTRLRQSISEAEIVVIDDNSSDGTVQRVTDLAIADPAIRLIVRDQRGLGGAIRCAMQVAIDGNYEFFLNLDGDLSHEPEQLPSLLDRAREPPPVDVVIGSRYVDGGSIIGWPLHRMMMSRLVNRFAMVALGLPVRDCSGSMRCYRVDALREIGTENLRSNGYSVLEEILVRLDRRGSAMAEVPITFTDRRRGQSKLTVREAFRSIFQMMRMTVRP